MSQAAEQNRIEAGRGRDDVERAFEDLNDFEVSDDATADTYLNMLPAVEALYRQNPFIYGDPNNKTLYFKCWFGELVDLRDVPGVSESKLQELRFKILAILKRSFPLGPRNIPPFNRGFKRYLDSVHYDVDGEALRILRTRAHATAPPEPYIVRIRTESNNRDELKRHWGVTRRRSTRSSS